MSKEYAICPYCGYEHGDCWEWVKYSLQTTTCDGCNKEFDVWADYSVTYITKKVKEEGDGA